MTAILTLIQYLWVSNRILYEHTLVCDWGSCQQLRTDGNAENHGERHFFTITMKALHFVCWVSQTKINNVLQYNSSRFTGNGLFHWYAVDLGELKHYNSLFYILFRHAMIKSLFMNAEVHLLNYSSQR